MTHDRVLLQAIVDDDAVTLIRFLQTSTIEDLERIEQKLLKTADIMRRYIADRKKIESGV